jgi:hypothetical protein
MGDFEQGNAVESTNHSPKSRSKAVILLIFGLFAPIMMMMNTWGMFTEINIQSMFWMYSQSSYMPSFFGFSLIPLYAMTSMFPFLLLRMVPVFQIYRYYNGKTTRKRALIASFIGDGVILLFTTPTIILSFMSGMFYFYMIPLPFQMIAGFVMLWRCPLPEPTTPWEHITEQKSWWEKKPEPPSDAPQEKQSSEPQQKKPADEDDYLW